MQLLAKIGFEGGESHGLNLIPGKVELMGFAKKKLTLPHVGWNKIEFAKLIVVYLMEYLTENSFILFIVLCLYLITKTM